MAKYLELVMESNVGFNLELPPIKDGNGQVIPIGDATFQCQMRRAYDHPVAEDVTVSVVNANAGTIKLVLDREISLPLFATRWVYDVLMNKPGLGIVKIFYGFIDIKPACTNAVTVWIGDEESDALISLPQDPEPDPEDFQIGVFQSGSFD